MSLHRIQVRPAKYSSIQRMYKSEHHFIATRRVSDRVRLSVKHPVGLELSWPSPARYPVSRLRVPSLFSLMLMLIAKDQICHICVKSMDG